MHYFRNGDLDLLISKRQKDSLYFDEIEVCEYMIQLVAGVAYLHEKKLLHRDLKVLFMNKFANILSPKTFLLERISKIFKLEILVLSKK
jgi:serine/threonine protein kinase